MTDILAFKCLVCGYVSSGRRPKGGDGSLVYPRRHKSGGVQCAGNLQGTEWVQASVSKGIIRGEWAKSGKEKV
jgi:hypothetical protein